MCCHTWSVRCVGFCFRWGRRGHLSGALTGVGVRGRHGGEDCGKCGLVDPKLLRIIKGEGKRENQENSRRAFIPLHVPPSFHRFAINLGSTRRKTPRCGTKFLGRRREGPIPGFRGRRAAAGVLARIGSRAVLDVLHDCVDYAGPRNIRPSITMDPNLRGNLSRIRKWRARDGLPLPEGAELRRGKPDIHKPRNYKKKGETRKTVGLCTLPCQPRIWC